MIQENGFDLLRIEVLNWGNFQGWQYAWSAHPKNKDELQMGGKPTHSLLLGLNGAGKSTLIDGLIVCLLPYEGSLKLGMTNDLEKGSSGGRSIESYVLGKHGSTDSKAELKTSSVYSRSSGASSVLLVFQHRGDLRKITLSRTWWYSDHKLKEDSAGFIGYGDFSLGPNDWKAEPLTDGEGRPYKSVRFLKQETQRRNLRCQVYDKNASYFSALSSEFGNVTKEDVKLLNKAFYMKSIEQIDGFIRDHMLIEKDQESIRILIDNVQQASEIQNNIERAEKELKLVAQIVSIFEERKNAYAKLHELTSQIYLLQLLPDWTNRNALIEKIAVAEARLKQIEIELPILVHSEKQHILEWERLDDLIKKHDLTNVLKDLKNRFEFLSQSITLANAQYQKVQNLSEGLEIKVPKNVGGLRAYHESLNKKREETQKCIESIHERETQIGIRKQQITIQSLEVRTQLKHLQDHSTRIDPHLYQIKLHCQEALKLPPKALLFVGELISVTSESKREFERAVEASLHPIANTLLCLPEYMEKTTRWVNENGLSRNLTVRRIQVQEMEAEYREHFDEHSILDKIEILELKKNPFFHYLWRWLIKDFNFKIVDVSELKKVHSKAVTVEGLTKPDERFIRKLKRDFHYQLGWNPEEEIQLKIGELLRLSEEESSLKTQTEHTTRERKGYEEFLTKIGILQQMEFNFFQLPDWTSEQKRIQDQIAELEKKKGTEFKKLEEEWNSAKHRADSSRDTLSRNRFAIENIQKELPLLNADLLSKTTLFEHKSHSPIASLSDSLVNLFPDLPKALDELAKAFPEDQARYQREHELEQEKNDLNEKISNSALGGLLVTHSREFNHPDLFYEIPSHDRLLDHLNQWLGLKSEIEDTRLVEARSKFNQFYNFTLHQAIKTAISDIKEEQFSIRRNIDEMNFVLKSSDYERLPTERRYLQLVAEASTHDWVRKFNADIRTISSLLVSDARRSVDQEHPIEVLESLQNWVESLHGEKNQSYFEFVKDVRNHFRFSVHSFRRAPHGQEDERVESFTGSRQDAKSSAQTTQLAYVLLASALAYRFHFRDPVKGKNSLRLIVLDEFGGKFDNEKPKDIVQFLDDMGFQSMFVSPMSKADLLAPSCGQMILVHKASAKDSKLGSIEIQSGKLEDACLALEAKMGRFRDEIQREEESLI